MGVAISPVDVARRLRRGLLTSIGRGVRTGIQTRKRSIRLGSSYGGWDVLPDLISSSSVVYSVGVGADVTWDLALIDRFGVRVDAFDPTPRSIRWVRSRQFPSAFVFHPLGLADFDGEAKFAMMNEDPDWSSYNLVRSGIELVDAVETVTAPVARLGTIMGRLGHDRIDVLKLDIEGAEYEVLADILLARIYPKQLLVEFHYFEHPAQRIGQTELLVRRLNEEGYRAFARSPNGYEFSFVHE